MNPLLNEPVVRHLGRSDYESVWREMQAFTDARSVDTQDEFWLVEHDPVFTQGQAGKAEHLLVPGQIPVVQSDRGGQVTYHGPGQLVCYLMVDVRRRKLTVRDMVSGIERSVIKLLESYGIKADADPSAPGVYVDGDKISALGLRVRRGCTYHGLSLNVDMDLEPFSRINPCGYKGLRVIDLASLGVEKSLVQVSVDLLTQLLDEFGYHALPPQQ